MILKNPIIVEGWKALKGSSRKNYIRVQIKILGNWDHIKPLFTNFFYFPLASLGFGLHPVHFQKTFVAPFEHMSPQLQGAWFAHDKMKWKTKKICVCLPLWWRIVIFWTLLLKQDEKVGSKPSRVLDLLVGGTIIWHTMQWEKHHSSSLLYDSLFNFPQAEAKLLGLAVLGGLEATNHSLARSHF